jgi:hypothetical protein
MELAVCNMPVSLVYIALDAVHIYNKHRTLINKILGGPLQHNRWKLIIKIIWLLQPHHLTIIQDYPVIPLATSTE